MLARNSPDRFCIAFDDRRLVANAGLLPATLAQPLYQGEVPIITSTSVASQRLRGKPPRSRAGCP